jgi:hypothetical protein
MRKSSEGWRRGALLLVGLLMATALPGRAISTTTVADTVFRADGGVAQGTLLVSWPSFTAADGSAVTAGSVTATIAANGRVSLQLTPNEGGQPAGTYYTAVYHLSDGTVEKEYWVVPQLPTTTIGMMRSKVVPAAVAQPMVSQQYVNSAVASGTAAYLPLKGGALTGALNLAGDPQSAAQAATKQYVDAHGVAALPAGIVFGSGGSAGRASTGADVVSLWGGASCTGFLKNDLTCAMPSLNLPNALVRGQGAGQPAIPAVYGDIVGLFGGGSCSGFIKSDGSCSTGVVTLPNALVRGNGTSPAAAATAADVAATFHTAGTPLINHLITTTFNEGAAGATLAGTSPATDTTGDTWHLFTGAIVNYATGGAVMPNPTSSSTKGATINAGASNVTLLAKWSSVPATGPVQLLMRYTDPGDMVAATITTTQVSIFDLVAGAFVMSGPFNVSPSSMKFVFSGNTLQIFSGTTLAGTASLNPANSNATNYGFAFQGPGTNATLASLDIQGTPIPVTLPCAGYLNADSTCNSVANSLLTADATGHFASFPEKQVSVSGGVASVVCDEDMGAGRFDPRCTKYAGGVFGSTPNLALQALANTLICYESQVGKQPTVYFPSGRFPVGTPTQPALVFPAGGNYYGTAGRNGGSGTFFQATYNNSNAVQFNTGQTATCADGSVHTANLNGGNYVNLAEVGVGQGGGINVPGDTGNWPNGGPNQNGIFIGDSQGYAHNIAASNNGSSGVICGGLDSVCDGLWGFGNMEWYWFGKNTAQVSAPSTPTIIGSTTGGTLAAGTYFYKITGVTGVGETTGSTEVTVTATGTTGSVALSWAALTGVGSYRVYRGTAAGAETGYYAASGTTFTDTGAAFTATATVPTLNTSVYNPATDGTHCDVVAISLDGQFKDIEVYGYQNASVGVEYGHLGGVCWGGGNSLLDGVFTNLGQIGILGVGASAARLSNFRIDAPRGEGLVTGYASGDGGNLVSNGLITTACAATNAIVAVAGSPIGAALGTHCNYLDGGASYSNIQLGYNNFFGASVATGGIWALSSEQDVNVTQTGVTGGLRQFPHNFYVGQGQSSYQKFATGGTSVVGTTGAPAPSISSGIGLNPTETTATTYTSVSGGTLGQEFSVYANNSNVTLQSPANGGHWHNCKAGDLNLGLNGAILHYTVTSGTIFGGPAELTENCDPVSAASSGGSAACGTANVPCTNTTNTFSADQTINGTDNFPLMLTSSTTSTTVSLNNTSAGGKLFRFFSSGAGNGIGAGFFGVVDITDSGTPTLEGLSLSGTTPSSLSIFKGTQFVGATVRTGTAFSASGCSVGSLVGGETAGSLTSGTAGTCTFTVSMGDGAAAPHGWACFVNDLTTPTDVLHQTATTATTATFSGTTANGDALNFACTGY